MQCAEKQKVAARTGLPSHKYCNSILKANQVKLSISLPFSAMKKAYTYQAEESKSNVQLLGKKYATSR